MSQNNISNFLIKVGSGDINHSKYGFKAKGLDSAAYKNILVPKGYLLPHEGSVQFENGNGEKNKIITEIQTLLTKPSIAIRSAFSVEDQSENSFAGVFDTVLSVNKNKPEEIIMGLKKVLKSAKGYYGARSKIYRVAKQAVIKAGQYAYRDRRQKKRLFRSLWIVRINAAARLHGLSYSKLINGLSLADIKVCLLYTSPSPRDATLSRMPCSG